MPLSFPVVSWPAIAPQVIVLGVGCLLLLFDLVPPRGRKAHLGVIGLFGLLAALGASLTLWGYEVRAFREMVALDRFALFFNLIFCVATALVLMLSLDSLPRWGAERGEYYALVLFAVLGMMLMASGTDLIVIFLGLELMSLCLYVLAGFFYRQALRSSESALKYFLLGAFATGFFLYGIALIYGATGSTNLEKVSRLLAQAGPGRDPMLFIGFGLLLVGFGFKTASVPFHMWAPDVYQGAPTAVTALIATASKAAAFAGLLRVLLGAIGPDWRGLLWILALLTMTVGNVVAIAQGNLKRMLAYSSVAHAGYMLVALVTASPEGAAGILFYLLVYTFANVGAFGAIVLLERGGEEAVEIADYAGLGSRHPALALCLSLFMLSLIGIPPLGGFVGKFYIFAAAIRGGYVWLAILGVLNSVVASYYYLRLIVYMYMREPEGVPVERVPSFPAATALAIALWGTIQLGLYPAPIFELARSAVLPLFR